MTKLLVPRLIARGTTGSGWAKKALAAGVVIAALVMVGLAAPPAHASTTFTVNNALDLGDGKCEPNGNCTLRDAILAANSTSNVGGPDLIRFSIPGTGVHTISPNSPLPPITEQVTIDGYTQPGASPNTKTVGDDAVLKIELDGANMTNAKGLEISNSSGSVIRGLVINRFDFGISIGGDSVGNRIEGNFIGTDPTGTIDRGNTFSAVAIEGNLVGGPSKTVVGGSTPDKRNVLSGNDSGIGIQLSNANRIQGNYVGTDKSGTKDLGNQHSGVAIFGASGTTIGGKTAASRNVISGNDFHGLDITDSSGRTSKRTKVLGNRIGTTANGNDAHGQPLQRCPPQRE